MFQTVATIWGLLLAVGAGIDVLVMRQHRRSRLHRWLVGLWQKIEKMRVPDIPREAAKTTVRAAIVTLGVRVPSGVERAHYKVAYRASVRAFAICVLYSLVINFAMLMLNAYTIGKDTLEAAIYYHFFGINLYVSLAYMLPNVLCDLITISVTLHVLVLIAEVRTKTVVVPVVVDLAIALTLAISVIALTDIFSSLVAGNPPTPFGEVWYAWQAVLWMTTGSAEAGYGGYVRGILYVVLALTTIVPSMILFVVIGLLAAGKLVAAIIRLIVLDILKNVQETKAEELLAATMTGAFLAFVATSILLLAKVSEFVWRA